VALKVSVIVCAHNEARYLAACLHSLLAQTRPPDEILVIDNASTDETRAVAEQIPQVRVLEEPRKSLVVAREAARSAVSGDILVYLDADCRAPLTWLERIERRFARAPSLVALCGPYRYYDWDRWGRLLIGTYDLTVAPVTQVLVKHVLRVGCIFYGGNFAARRDALDRVGGFDTSIDFHGEDTNIGRRLFGIGRVALCRECYLYTSARRFKTMGKTAVIRLYVRNFTSELLRHRPKDVTHVDVRG
jgi:glycosyltransferase involved in cell wall biosynthesis